jgi:hypothetical protein
MVGAMSADVRRVRSDRAVTATPSWPYFAPPGPATTPAQAVTPAEAVQAVSRLLVAAAQGDSAYFREAIVREGARCAKPTSPRS